MEVSAYTCRLPHSCICNYMYLYIYANMDVNTCINMYTYTFTYVYMRLHIYVYACICIDMYIHTHVRPHNSVRRKKKSMIFFTLSILLHVSLYCCVTITHYYSLSHLTIRIAKLLMPILSRSLKRTCLPHASAGEQILYYY